MALGVAGLGQFAGGVARGISEAERLRTMQEQRRNLAVQGQLLRQAIEENNNKLGMQQELQGMRPENYQVSPRSLAIETRTPTYEGMTGGLDQQDIPMQTERSAIQSPGGVDRERMLGDMAGVYYRHGNPAAGMQLENLRDNVRYQETLRSSREALAMLSTGNVGGAAKLVQDSFNKIPNGVMAKADATADGNINVTFYDQNTGHALQSKTMTPDEMRQGVLMLTDPKSYQTMVDKGLDRQKDAYVAYLNNLDKIYPRSKFTYGTFGEDHQPIALDQTTGNAVFLGVPGQTQKLLSKDYKFSFDAMQKELLAIYKVPDITALDEKTRAQAMNASYMGQQALSLNYDRTDEVGQQAKRAPGTFGLLGDGLARLRVAAQEGGNTKALAEQLGFKMQGTSVVYGREGSPYVYTLFRGKEYIVGTSNPQAPLAGATGAPPSQAITEQRGVVTGVNGRRLAAEPFPDNSMNGPTFGRIRRPGQ